MGRCRSGRTGLGNPNVWGLTRILYFMTTANPKPLLGRVAAVLLLYVFCAHAATLRPLLARHGILLAAADRARRRSGHWHSRLPEVALGVMRDIRSAIMSVGEVPTWRERRFHVPPWQFARFV